MGLFRTVDPDNRLQHRQMFHYSITDDARGRFRVQGNRLHVAYDNSSTCVSEQNFVIRLKLHSRAELARLSATH